MQTDTIPSRLFEQARRIPFVPALFEKQHGTWIATTYKSYATQVKQAAKALMALGFAPGSSACILGFNRPEWAIFDIATMSAGGVPAGIYTTCSPSEVGYIVNHCEAAFILVENEQQYKKIEQEWSNLPHLKHVVTMRPCGRISDPRVIAWDDFMAQGDCISDDDFFERMAALKPDGLATLIYTSGTTGPPKGVMLTHHNLAWTALLIKNLVSLTSTDVSISYLPLCHIAEQMLTLHGPITGGSSVYFAESIEKVADNIKEIEPTVFLGVPRIWEKFHSGIRQKLNLAPSTKKRIANFAMGIGAQVNGLKNRGEPVPRILQLQYALANKLVFSKLKAALGFGRVRFCVSGAAPVAQEILEFLASLDIVIYEVYGQSEDTGPTSLGIPGQNKYGAVGKVIPGVEVHIAEDGEILVRGPNVFAGYYKDKEATREALQDGWLHSGDLGQFDKDGYLMITGRKKDILITAGGKNITPKNMESTLKNHPLVAEAVVIGDRRKYLTALLWLNEESVKSFLQEKAIASTKDWNTCAEIRTDIQSAVDAMNADLARVETIKKFTIMTTPLSIETGELTPTLKVKRNVITKKFDKEIEAMYQGDE